MSIMTATGRGAQIGVLVKNAEALERFAKIDTDGSGGISEAEMEAAKEARKGGRKGGGNRDNG